MARRTITIVFDENLTDEHYADAGNGIWGRPEDGPPGRQVSP